MKFRVETVDRPSDGQVRVEIYDSAEAIEPIFVTPYMYRSHEAAKREVVKIFKEAHPLDHVTVKDSPSK